MIKILDSSLKRLGTIKNVIDSSRMEEINGENILDFNAVLDSKLNNFISESTVFELYDDYFDIAYFKKNSNEDNTYTVEVESEHISYRLNNPEFNIEFFTESGTPAYILEKILEGTGFTVGAVEYTDVVTYSAQEAKSRRQLLMEFVAYLGGEAYFNKFEIGIVQHRGSSNIKPVIKGKNVRVVSKIYNKRDTDENGNSLVSYACEPVYLPGDDYAIGDEVLLIQKDLGILERLRVVRLAYNPYDNMSVSFEFANYINGLEDQLYRIETRTVTKDKVYNGTRIGPEYGFEAIRSDKKARAYFNSTNMVFQAGDGTGQNWTNKLYYDFDPDTGAATLVFDGKLSADVITALEAEFDITISNTFITQTLAAETGTIAQLTVDQVETSTKVQNYLTNNIADVNYIKVFEQYIQFITASTDGTEDEQAKDRNGNLLYWVSEDHEGTTLDETYYPVMIYVYEEFVKAEFAFESDEGNYIPQIILGTGDGVSGNSAKAIIKKGATGLELNYYTSNQGELRQIKLSDDGIFITPYDLEQLDFYNNGFTTKYSGESISWKFKKDSSGKITKLVTEDDIVIPINWNGGNI